MNSRLKTYFLCMSFFVISLLMSPSSLSAEPSETSSLGALTTTPVIGWWWHGGHYYHPYWHSSWGWHWHRW